MNDDVMSLSSKAGYIVGDVVAEERHCHLATDFLADHSKENVFGLRNYADPNSDQKGEKSLKNLVVTHTMELVMGSVAIFLDANCSNVSYHPQN